MCRGDTTTTMTPAEVHEVGLGEVARIEKRYQQDVLEKLAFRGSFDQFVAQVSTHTSVHTHTHSLYLSFGVS